MESTEPASIWASGTAYERYVGRWSREAAREFLAWLEVAPGRRWLDVGCGTGALSATILDLASPSAVTGIDSSAGFLAHARVHVTDPRVTFIAGDATTLPVPDGAFDAAVSGLVLNFVSQPGSAVAEMARAVERDGVVAVYVWDYAEGMALMRAFWDAATALDPATAAHDEGRRFGAICHPDALAALFEAAGLRDVETRAIEIPTRFPDFDDCWTPFLGGQGPAPAYVSSLAPGQRDALRDAFQSRLLIAADGTIALTARAWAVRGRR